VTAAGAKNQFRNDPVLHTSVAVCRYSSVEETAEPFCGGFLLLSEPVLYDWSNLTS